MKICLCGVIPPWLKLGAALYTESTDGGGEDGDDEINDGFPVYFHILLLILMFNNILINLKKGQYITITA